MSSSSPELSPDCVTPKQRALVDEYVRNGGNGTRAALKTRDITDPDVAGVVASQTLRIPKVQRYLHLVARAANVTPRRLFGKLDKALDATRTIVGDSKDSPAVQVEDYPTQLRAVEIAAKLLKLGGYGDKPQNGKSAKSQTVRLETQPQPIIDFILAAGRVPTPEERERLLNPIQTKAQDVVVKASDNDCDLAK